MPYPQDDNGRITNVVLASKLDTLSKQVETLGRVLNRRMDFLEEKLELNVGAVRENCQNNETNIARLEERQKSTTSIQTGLMLVLSSVAATIGAVFK